MKLPVFSALEWVLAGIVLIGLITIGLGLVNLLHKFVPGSSPSTASTAKRRDLVAAELSLGWGLAVFGLASLVLLYLDASPSTSILVGLGIGLLVSFAILSGLIYLNRPVSSLDPLEAEGLVGRPARVVIAVPATGIGEVEVVGPDGPVHLAARSIGDHSILVGAAVVVERTSNRVAVVREIAG